MPKWTARQGKTVTLPFCAIASGQFIVLIIREPSEGDGEVITISKWTFCINEVFGLQKKKSHYCLFWATLPHTNPTHSFTPANGPSQILRILRERFLEMIEGPESHSRRRRPLEQHRCRFWNGSGRRRNFSSALKRFAQTALSKARLEAGNVIYALRKLIVRQQRALGEEATASRSELSTR